MTRYIDPFGRETSMEISTHIWNNRIGFVIRKERQSIAESMDIETAESLIKDLQGVVAIAKFNKENKNG